MEFDIQTTKFLKSDAEVIKIRYELYHNYIKSAIINCKSRINSPKDLVSCYKEQSKYMQFSYDFGIKLYEEYSKQLLNYDNIDETSKINEFKQEYLDYLKELSKRSQIE